MRSTATTMTVGIVGAGEISRKAHLPVLVNMPGVRIAWIHDVRPESARTLARSYGLRTRYPLSSDDLPVCDVLLLAIPVDARAGYLDHVCSRGGAALCEKPFAMTVAEHRRLLDRFSGHALGVGFMRRFFRSTVLLRQIVADGIFGPLLRLDISEGSRTKSGGAASSFLNDARPSASRGVLTDLGSHTIDLALFVSGATDFEIRSCAKVMDGSIDRKVSAAVQLRTAGQTVELGYSVSWLDRQENRILLTFERAKVWSALAPGAEVFVGNPESPREAIRLDLQSRAATTYNQAFYLEWQDFLASLRTGHEPVTSARSALLTTSLCEALGAAGSAAHA